MLQWLTCGYRRLFRSLAEGRPRACMEARGTNPRFRLRWARAVIAGRCKDHVASHAVPLTDTYEDLFAVWLSMQGLPSPGRIVLRRY